MVNLAIDTDWMKFNKWFWTVKSFNRDNIFENPLQGFIEFKGYNIKRNSVLLKILDWTFRNFCED